jgi:N utilization substance protein A
MDDENHRIEVVVEDNQLSLAIGRRGQNVRLASILTHLTIDITTESDETLRRAEEFKTRSQLFLAALDVDEVIAHLLVTEGFTTIEEIAYTPLEEFLHIEGFDAEVAQELIDRSHHYLEKQKEVYTKQLKELALDTRLMNYEELTPEMLVILGENSIKTLEDFADLSNDELVELLQDKGMTNDLASHLIMDARKEINPEEQE